VSDRIPLTDQQLDEYETRATAATRCPKAVANGRQDGQHTWRGSLTHLRCELCNYTRPRGERAEETAALVAEVRRLRNELERRTEDLAFLERATLPELRREVERHKDGKARWRARAEKAEARVTELERPAATPAVSSAVSRP
jgi:chromosome segregation ATPase